MSTDLVTTKENFDNSNADPNPDNHSETTESSVFASRWNSFKEKYETYKAGTASNPIIIEATRIIYKELFCHDFDKKAIKKHFDLYLTATAWDILKVEKATNAIMTQFETQVSYYKSRLHESHVILDDTIFLITESFFDDIVNKIRSLIHKEVTIIARQHKDPSNLIDYVCADHTLDVVFNTSDETIIDIIMDAIPVIKRTHNGEQILGIIIKNQNLVTPIPYYTALPFVNEKVIPYSNLTPLDLIESLSTYNFADDFASSFYIRHAHTDISIDVLSALIRAYEEDGNVIEKIDDIEEVEINIFNLLEKYRGNMFITNDVTIDKAGLELIKSRTIGVCESVTKKIADNKIPNYDIEVVKIFNKEHFCASSKRKYNTVNEAMMDIIYLTNVSVKEKEIAETRNAISDFLNDL